MTRISDSERTRGDDPKPFGKCLGCPATAKTDCDQPDGERTDREREHGVRERSAVREDPKIRERFVDQIRELAPRSQAGRVRVEPADGGFQRPRVDRVPEVRKREVTQW